MSQKPPQILSSVRGTTSLANAISSATSIEGILGDEMLGYDSTSAFHSPAYHELLENPHVELDGLQRLQENLAQLEDLHGRLQFLMRDLTGLLRKR